MRSPEGFSIFSPLTGGAYQSRSLIAAAQRCLNLYPEQTPPTTGEPMAVAHLCTPGLTLLSTAPGDATIRGLYTASNGDLYAVAGTSLYCIDSTWQWHLLGHMLGSTPADATPRLNPTSMVDSGISLLLVDGSTDGWTLTLIQASVRSGSTAATSSSSGITLGMAVQGANIPPNTTVAAITATGFTLSQAATGTITNATLRLGFARINSLNQTVTGTVTSAAITSGLTVIIDTVAVTTSSTDTSIADVVTAINNQAIPNISAYQETSGALTIKDSSGTAIIIGPGTANTLLGLTDGAYGVPDAGGFYGADRVDFTDTYFLANKPGTPIFYVSESESTNFDSLDFAGKSAKADNLVTLIVSHRIIWLLGSQNTELWYDGGGGAAIGGAANTFPFESFPNTLIQRGIAAKYSLAQAEGQIYFLSQDVTGQGMVMMGTGSQAIRISTHAIEYEISQYATISDAIGTIYQQQGHTFYMLSFPTGDATWCYDATTHEWHERSWLDGNGFEHRHRVNFTTFAYGTVVGSDWENGSLYALDLANYTDNGFPIKRLRCFPHQLDMDGNRRISYKQFIAHMQVGSNTQSLGPQIFIQTGFTAPDSTLLQDYTGTGDIGSNYSLVSGENGEIFHDGLIGVASGTSLYLASGQPITADYTISFQAQPSTYASIPPSTIYAVARANLTYQGYQLAVAGTEDGYTVSLTIMVGTTYTVIAGSLTAGYYAVSLSLSGAMLTATCQRSQDNLWLTSLGAWQAETAPVISISDTTYTAPGRVLIGGSW